MSSINDIVQGIMERISDWDASNGIVFIRTRDDNMRRRLHRCLGSYGIPNVNIYTLGNRLEELLAKHKLVMVTSTMRDAARFEELSESMAASYVSRRVFRLARSDGEDELEPYIGEVVIEY